MKPFLIFVEGEQSPYRVHLDDLAAIKEGHRLANKFPGKDRRADEIPTLA